MTSFLRVKSNVGFYGVLLLGLLANEASSSSCTDACDVQYMGAGIPITFCGTDFLTHSTTWGAVTDPYCYAVCGVMAQHQGACGCPNDCFKSEGQGMCTLQNDIGSCVCSEGYTGEDCSLPSSDSKCSLHGSLVSPTDTKSEFPFEYCACDHGFTGTDCSNPICGVGNSHPWKTIFGSSDDVYTNEDDYKDNHPIFNISVLPTIRIDIRAEDLLDLLQPWNLYNESYAPATMHFDNGNVRETMSNVGFRVKGATSRLLNKKGWYIKFNEFNESGRSWYQMKKLGFKAGSRNDDTLLKSMLYTDFSRALGVAVQRASYSLLYINDIYAGVYFMHEDINPDFMTRRFDGDNGSGNNMKLFYDVNLQYYGSDLSYYKTVNYTNQLKVPLFWYEQSDGDGNWTDFIDWLQFINLSSDATFAKEIEQRVGVTLLLRQMMVESFMLASDNLASGANYYTYHRTSAPTAQWEVIEFDFDECFDFNDGKNQNIFQFFSDKSTSELNPMVNRILNIPSFNETFKVEYSEFLGAVFGSTSQQQPTFRYSGYLQFILPWVVKDKLWQVALGMTPSDFILDAENSISHLDLRYQEVAMQLN